MSGVRVEFRPVGLGVSGAVVVTGAASGIGRAAVDLDEAGLKELAHLERVRTVAGDRILDVNLRGPILGIRAALPALRSAGGGAIVVTASVAGLRGDPGNWAYNASKAAVINLVRSVALDHAAEGIRINAVAPGLTRTAINAVALADPSVEAAFERLIPAQRLAEPREQAEAIWFLASSAASYITGTTLVVDGGLDAGVGLLPLPARPPAPTAEGGDDE